MSEADRERWNARYEAGSYLTRRHPSSFLRSWLRSLPRGSALDVACGRGRNALLLAAHGYTVDAIDISPVALEGARARAQARGLSVNWICADLDVAEIAAERYDLVIVSRYLNRTRIPDLRAALRPGGALVYEQHLSSVAPVAGPRNPAFRLRPNELLRLFSDLRIVTYCEGLTRDPDGALVALARLVAVRQPEGPLDLRLP